MKRNLKLMLTVLVLLVMLTPLAAASFADINVDVIKGVNRIETAIEISKANFTTSPTAILTTAYNFPDATAGIHIAKQNKAPILLTEQEALPPSVLKELNRLKAKNVIILGSEGVVSKNIENVLKSKFSVRRIGGTSRYETNQMVNNEVFKDKGKVTEIFAVNGTRFSDVISIAPYAFHNDIPIVYTDSNGDILKMVAKSYPNLKKVTLIGGPTILSDNLLNEWPTVERLSGPNRYLTSRAIDDKYFSNTKQLYVTTGEDFPDAITGTVVLKPGENIALVKNRLSELSSSQKTRNMTILGGRIANDINGVTVLEKGDRNNPVAIYVNPHQDDETLSMGAQLAKDITAGKEVYILQFTRGDLTKALIPINERLKNEGYPEINRTQLGEARTREMTAGLVAAGLPAENVIQYPYNEKQATTEQIAKDIETFVAKFPGRTIQLRSLIADLRYDVSAGNYDHTNTENAAKLFMLNNPGRVTSYRQFLGSWKASYPAGYVRMYTNPQETANWHKMIDAFGVWDPANGRYRVGYYSIESAFHQVKENGFSYMVE